MADPNPPNVVDFDEDTAKHQLAAGLRATQATTEELWNMYSSIGGDMDEIDLVATVFGPSLLSQFQYQLISVALAELIEANDPR